MLEIEVPGYKVLRLEHLLLDFNGTLACNGELLGGVSEALTGLAGQLRIHVLTGDTFGKAKDALANLPCEFRILPATGQDLAKLHYLQTLGGERCAAIGNGRNDRLMLEAAELAIAVSQGEGLAVQALMAAEIVVPDIGTALGLLSSPLRLIATLRS
jgi:soluble P-type ATPase